MKKPKSFLFGEKENLTPDRVANLLIPLMGAVYAKQQLALLKDEELSLSDGFRAVVKDILVLSKEVSTMEREVRRRLDDTDPDLVN